MEWSDIIAYLRFLAYAALALLMGVVIPVYHASFRMTWRVAGIFFAVGGVSVLLRLYAGNGAAEWWNANVLTPVTLLLAATALVNLGLVSAFYGPGKREK